MLIATRGSFGVSTSATESKGIFRQSRDKGVKDIQRKSNSNVNGQFDFGKLVSSIMQNPFVSSSGLNNQA